MFIFYSSNIFFMISGQKRLAVTAPTLMYMRETKNAKPIPARMDRGLTGLLERVYSVVKRKVVG